MCVRVCVHVCGKYGVCVGGGVDCVGGRRIKNTSLHACTVVN